MRNAPRTPANPNPARKALARGGAIAAALVIAAAAALTVADSPPKDGAPPPAGQKLTVQTTGYCNCRQCCSWRRSWCGLGVPVYASGKLKGKRKAVGITALGTTAKHGTLAADTKCFPMRTKLFVPGYGVGTVEDVGGKIRGFHLDLWFPTHAEAKRWGVRHVEVYPVK